MSKPWSTLTEDTIADLNAQLGVYEVADEAGKTIRIGYAGGTQPFGMRSALADELGHGATHFRYEFTHAYMTRWNELLMLHQADHGILPPGNDDRRGRIGRLSPGGSA